MIELTDREKRILPYALALVRKGNTAQYIPHAPHPKQAEFLALDAREALYGGAAAGGKSDALLMGALEYVHVPGYAALLLRRTYADLSLPGAIMDRAKEWLAGSDAKWNDRDKRFTFPSGAVLQFGFLDTDRDRFRYQSSEYHFVGWDELTQFPEQWYRYLFSRQRRIKGLDVPIRMRAATNPGGLGHEWVRRRFINPGDPKRPFVPARLEDNPSVDAEEYREALSNLDETTRRQLEEGQWIRDTEGLVYRYSDTKNAVHRAPECQKFILGIDYGMRSPTAFVRIGWRHGDPTVYVLEAWKKAGMSPQQAAVATRKIQETCKLQRIVGDTGGLGAGYADEAIKHFRIPIEPAEKNNKLGYIKLLNGEMERGRIKIQTSTCEPLVKELCELPWHEERDKEAEGFDNHCTDALLYAWRASTAFLEPEAEMGEPTTTPEAIEKVEKERKVKYLEGLRKAQKRAAKYGRPPVTHQRLR